MPSIVSGFEYDIFISYRHNDNRSGWVTEFVNALQEELASTIKEPLSIYFDKNPHDGLHENHDVDDSLQEKLKCLVFIPIVSRTYCDTKSFAWVHEFKAFLSLARRDSIGLKVKIPHGNVASRVLPVRIHEIAQDDIKLFEAEIQSVMRPIDFIYKSSGVNRPLLPSDKKEDNTNHTIYRDQINKVANAISEIVSGLSDPQPQPAVSSSGQTIATQNSITPSKRKWLTIVASAILLFAIIFYLFFPKTIGLKAPADSGIAILPFTNNTGSTELDFYGVGMASEVRTKLSMSKQFKFISSLQATLPYTNTNKSPKEISSELGVDFLLSGLYQKAGNKIRVLAELIDAETGNVTWSLPYERELDDIFLVQAEIAEQVLKRLTLNATQTTEPKTTLNLQAYAHYLRGYELYYTQEDQNHAISLQPSISQFERAIALDSTFVDAWVGLIDAEAYVVLNDANDSIRQKRVNRYVDYFHNHFPDAWQNDLVDGMYNYRVTRHYQPAIRSLEKVLQKDPQNLEAVLTLSYVYKRSFEFAKSIRFKKQAIALEPSRGSHWRDLSETLTWMGDGKSALEAILKAWELNHSKRIADLAQEITLDFGLPSELLPDDLKDKSGEDYALWKNAYARDWRAVRKLSIEKKDTIWLAASYFYENKKDSACYWAQQGLTHKALTNYEFLYSYCSNRAKAFAVINNNFQKRIEMGDDKFMQCIKLNTEIHTHADLKEYKEATEKLIKMNEQFPDNGRYEHFQTSPFLDNIRKEYPPFLEALKNIKRKPMVDVKEIIKM